MSPGSSLERIGIEEALTVLRRRGARPDFIDDRARHPSAATSMVEEGILAERVGQD